MAGLPPAPPAGPPPPPPPPSYGPLPYGYPSPYGAAPPYAAAGPAPGLRYAGFWIRFLAYLVDAVILDVPLGLIAFLILSPSIQSVSCTPVDQPFGSQYQCTGLTTFSSLLPALALGALVVTGVYFVVCWARYGRTVGQALCGLRVVDAATGGRITTSRAIGRYLGFIISGWVLDIGLIWAAFDAQKQGWHDKMASTFVVRRA